MHSTPTASSYWRHVKGEQKARDWRHGEWKQVRQVDIQGTSVKNGRAVDVEHIPPLHSQSNSKSVVSPTIVELF